MASSSKSDSESDSRLWQSGGGTTLSALEGASVTGACAAGGGRAGGVEQFVLLLHLPLRDGRQVVHGLPDLWQAHLTQRPLPLHRQHAGILFP